MGDRLREHNGLRQDVVHALRLALASRSEVLFFIRATRNPFTE